MPDRLSNLEVAALEAQLTKHLLDDHKVDTAAGDLPTRVRHLLEENVDPKRLGELLAKQWQYWLNQAGGNTDTEGCKAIDRLIGELLWYFKDHPYWIKTVSETYRINIPPF